MRHQSQGYSRHIQYLVREFEEEINKTKGDNVNKLLKCNKITSTSRQQKN